MVLGKESVVFSIDADEEFYQEVSKVVEEDYVFFSQGWWQGLSPFLVLDLFDVGKDDKNKDC